MLGSNEFKGRYVGTDAIYTEEHLALYGGWLKLPANDGIHRANTLLVMLFDSPNCVLVLKPDAAVTILHWQVHRAAPPCMLLHPDRPELVANRVRLVVG